MKNPFVSNFEGKYKIFEILFPIPSINLFIYLKKELATEIKIDFKRKP